MFLCILDNPVCLLSCYPQRSQLGPLHMGQMLWQVETEVPRENLWCLLASNQTILFSHVYTKIWIKFEMQSMLFFICLRSWYNLHVQSLDIFCAFTFQLQNLDLRNNRISNLDGLKELHEAAPQIYSLHLGENNVSYLYLYTCLFHVLGSFP